MLTPQEENFTKALYAKHRAEMDLQNKIQEYTDFRASLDDAKDSQMIQKSKPLEDETRLLQIALDKAQISLDQA